MNARNFLGVKLKQEFMTRNNFYRICKILNFLNWIKKLLTNASNFWNKVKFKI